MEISAREFRMHMKDCLDAALAGERICINRGGIKFVLLIESELTKRVHTSGEPVYTPVEDIA